MTGLHILWFFIFGFISFKIGYNYCKKYITTILKLYNIDFEKLEKDFFEEKG